jgi:hypothetical protein
MLFRKRHYEQIASVMQEARRIQATLTQVEDLLVSLFKRDNGEFKPDRFRKACQPGNNVRART